MEQDLAIMLADLSGYTALTETHGSVAAADMIDKYIGIVENCLVGDCRLHERTGDEIMVVSESADALISTAIMIERKTCSEENFLQVHGGLHFGKLLMRNGSYFGSTINLASRIAARAKEGMFWCSEHFVNALADPSRFILESKGLQLFKNIQNEIEVFEIGKESTGNFFVDPVCRMLIIEAQKATPHPDNAGLYFCSSHCLDIYKINAKSSDGIVEIL